MLKGVSFDNGSNFVSQEKFLMNEDIYTVFNKKLTDKRMKRKSISYFVTYFVQVKNIVLTLPIIMSPSFNFRTASSDPKRDSILYDQIISSAREEKANNSTGTRSKSLEVDHRRPE